MSKTEFTVEVTIAGETRTVEAVTYDFWENRRAHSLRAVGAFQKRPGQKVWCDTLTFWLQPDGSWKVAQSNTFLNRSGYRLIGWADKQDKNRSEHNSARG